VAAVAYRRCDRRCCRAGRRTLVEWPYAPLAVFPGRSRPPLAEFPLARRTDERALGPWPRKGSPRRRLRGALASCERARPPAPPQGASLVANVGGSRSGCLDL